MTKNTKKEQISEQISVIFVYAIVTIVILTPFLLRKYLFLLDYNTNTNIHSALDLFYGKEIPIFGGFVPIYIILSIVNMELSQKILLLSILPICGYSMHMLVGKIVSSKIVRFYAGILYMINPYTYARIIVNHWHILISYAMVPFLLISFIDILEKKDIKKMINFIFILSIVAFNIHVLIIALIMMIIIFLLWFDKYKDIVVTKILLISGILFILLSSYWLVPILTAKNTLFDNINNKDIEVFAPKIYNLPDLFNVASMYGFWREGYIYAKDFIPYWQLLSIFTISLAIYGFISYYKDDKIGYLVKALGSIGIIGFILATGINGPFGDINHWLYDNTMLKGFRDSHKFVAMIVFAYAVLGGLGIEKLSKNAKKEKRSDSQ